MAEAENAVKVPTWLTVDIFSDVLHKEFPNFDKTIKFDVKPAISVGENFMTELLRANIQIQLKDGSSTSASYVIKVLPFSEPMLSMIKNWKVFEKEQRAYDTYIPAFEQLYREAGKNLRFGPSTMQPTFTSESNTCLIMEDLRLQKFTNVRRQLGLDLEHTKAVLSKLAEFHAASACYFEKHGPYPAIYNQSLCSTQDDFEEYRYTQCKHFRECLKYYNNVEHLNEKIKTYRKLMPDMFQEHSSVDPHEFQVLNHGDFWINNFMVQYDDSSKIKDVRFIDFQMCRYGSPAHDLFYLLLTSTHVDIKIKEFDYFVYYYHQQLVQNLQLLKYSKPLPLVRDLQIALLRHGDWALTIVLNVLPVALLDPTEDASKDNIIAESEDAADLKKKMYTNQRFIDHINVILPWLNNRGLLEYTPLKK